VTRLGAGALTLKTNAALHKGATFHSPQSPPSSPETAAFYPPSLPRRSQTSLDDVVDAHRRRVALALGAIDKTLSQQISSLSLSETTLRDDSLPVPRSFLESTVDSSIMSKQADSERRVLRPRPHRRQDHHHASDSGVGTSISSMKDKAAAAVAAKKEKRTNRAAAITRSAATRSATMEKVAGLGSKATNRIYEHTLKPILAKPALKDFHPLVLDCPRRIQEKEIVCLRDLEKTLLLMAPVSELKNDIGVQGDAYRALCLKEKTKVAGIYLDFCLTTIRCIQATVEFLSDREQTRPRDLPYTNGYFVDLVDQIRQYAEQLADAKAQKTSRASGEMEVDSYVNPRDLLLSPTYVTDSVVSTDEVKLHGGIQVNGRPAELVRVKKNGKAFSIATGELIEELEEDSKDGVRIKRSASEELEDEEEIMRSMARRKKNATPEELAPKKCREPGCNKEFKRPCDLTKHEKTHSRPWKCPVPSCKYHEYGWPTEKEMDRHHNDKHSSAPPMYECLYKPCPYKSKRESNCKQHMEKAHGWTYVRTKTNGKKGDSLNGDISIMQPTPPLINLPTPTSDYVSVATPPEEPFGRLYNNIDFPTFAPDLDLSMIPQDIQLDFSPLDNPSPSTDSGSDSNSAYQTLDTDMTLYEDIYAAPVQIPAMPHQMFVKQNSLPRQVPAYSAAPACQPQAAPHFSPTGHGNSMLYTPVSLNDGDEAFDDFPAGSGSFGADFVLYPTAAPSKSLAQHDALFGAEVPSLAAGYSQPNSQDFMNSFNIDWQAAAALSQFTSQQ
jgi:hypothetical protein